MPQPFPSFRPMSANVPIKCEVDCKFQLSFSARSSVVVQRRPKVRILTLDKIQPGILLAPDEPCRGSLTEVIKDIRSLFFRQFSEGTESSIKYPRARFREFKLHIEQPRGRRLQAR